MQQNKWNNFSFSRKPEIMQVTSIQQSNPKSTFLLALFVLLSCWGLFWLDYETKSISDLFKPGNLVALLIYFVPTFLITYLIYLFFHKKMDNKKSLIGAILIGIPASFTLIMLAFYLRS